MIITGKYLKKVMNDDGEIEITFSIPHYQSKWFKEAYRTLKHGGYCIMFGMDRQLLLFKYYANLAGFEEQQSLYWYFISNFPKATDLSKMIDKNAGAEREVVKISTDRRDDGTNYELGMTGNITSSNAITELGKKYEGYKYSISPLKQTNETILIFRKPYKSGSCLHDTLAFENGDNECRCGALNIDGNRVATNDDLARINKNDNGMFGVGNNNNNKAQQMKEQGLQYGGRYPSQTLCDSNTAEVLDKQSGISKGGTPKLNSEINRVGLKEDVPAFNSNNSGIDDNKGEGMGNYETQVVVLKYYTNATMKKKTMIYTTINQRLVRANEMLGVMIYKKVQLLKRKVTDLGEFVVYVVLNN